MASRESLQFQSTGEFIILKALWCLGEVRVSFILSDLA